MKEAAGRLGITVNTLKTHKRRLFGKLAVHSIAQAGLRWHAVACHPFGRQDKPPRIAYQLRPSAYGCRKQIALVAAGPLGGEIPQPLPSPRSAFQERVAWLRHQSANLRHTFPKLGAISPNLRHFPARLRDTFPNLREPSANLRESSPELRESFREVARKRQNPAQPTALQRVAPEMAFTCPFLPLSPQLTPNSKLQTPNS